MKNFILCVEVKVVRLSRKNAVSFLLILMLMLTGCGGASGDPDAESVQNSSNAVSDNSGVTEESAAPETESDAAEEIADGASEVPSKENEDQDKSTQSDAVKKEIENVTEGSENHFTCEYDGIEHEFVMYLPESGDASQSPLTKYTSSDAEDAEKSKQVWNLFIPDGRHSWPDEGVTGININHLIVEFLNEN